MSELASLLSVAGMGLRSAAHMTTNQRVRQLPKPDTVTEEATIHMLSYGMKDAEGWRRASFCSAGECIEVAKRDGMIVLRDSKDPRGGVLAYSVDEFRAFARGIRAGEFDDLFAP